jgi:mRNA interferase RelE/StbE
VSYEILLKITAQRQLDSIKGKTYNRIATVISNLHSNPRPANTRKLTDTGLWRIRIGNYRLLYAIDDQVKSIMIIRIAKRNKAFKSFTLTYTVCRAHV